MNRWLHAFLAAPLIVLAGLLPLSGLTHAATSNIGLSSSDAASTVTAMDRLGVARTEHSANAALTADARRNVSIAGLATSLRAMRLTTWPTANAARLHAIPPAAGVSGTRRVPQLRAATSAIELALPASIVDQTYASQYAVSAGGGPFRVFHSSWTGFESDVAASFDFQPIATVYYQGSVFDTANEAAQSSASSFVVKK
jgi:hypothetical protein